MERYSYDLGRKHSVYSLARSTRLLGLTALTAAMLFAGCGTSDGGDAGTGGSAGTGGMAGAGGTGGMGGAAGSGGIGGMAGSGGSAGSGGVGGVGGGAMCESALDCDDDNECTNDSCNPVNQTCDNAPVEDGTVCDADGLPGTCEAGLCAAEPQWGEAEQISPEAAADAIIPRVASDAEGNAIVVWQQTDNAGTRHVWARHFTPSNGWASAQRISNGESDVNQPRVAVDAAGNGIVVWYQFERKVTDLLTIHNIWAIRYTPSSGWGTPEVIEDNAGNADSAEVATNSDGIQMVVWRQHPDGNGYTDIWGRKYDPSQGWDIPRAVEVNAENSSQARPAVDENGDAIAVWVQMRDIWTGRYTPMNGWGTSEPLTDSGTGANGPVVAVDTSGNATAVWSRTGCSTTCNAWAARYTHGGSWADPEPINGQGESANGFDLAFDIAGMAMVLWNQSGNIWNNRYSPQTGWGSAALVEQSQAHAGQPSFEFDADGNATAVWHESEGADYSVEAASFTPSGGWEVSERIDGGAVQLGAPNVAVDPEGKATAVWYEYDGLKSSVWANRYE